jgi:hypothetical protein
VKINLECSVCTKTHDVDLREIEDPFICDACGNQGNVLDQGEIDHLEKQMLLGGKMKILAVFFTLASLFAFLVWMEAFNLDNSPGQFHEKAKWIYFTCVFVVLVSGFVHSFNNKRVVF